MTAVIIPTMRYRDARSMVDWLVEAFGFDRHLVVDDADGGVSHAELIFGNGMVMLGNAQDDEFGKLQKTAQDLGGNSQSAYIIVSDVDAIYRKARAAGADIVMEPKDEDYGGRGFSCRDPEGQLWNFGSYDPWQTPG